MLIPSIHPDQGTAEACNVISNRQGENAPRKAVLFSQRTGEWGPPTESLLAIPTLLQLNTARCPSPCPAGVVGALKPLRWYWQVRQGADLLGPAQWKQMTL